MSAPLPPLRLARLRLSIRGAVQGVGFRPFVFRLAAELGLKGWVNNSAQGVLLEVEGARDKAEEFLLRLEAERPPRSFIQSLEPSWLDPAGFPDFTIRQSEAGGARTALVLPDIATCADCRREIFDPADRRYFYPFTNCTHCGPRFSIIEALPYDRAHTSMRRFAMCPECQAEYEDPRHRRFHAQPNACPVCGPRLRLLDPRGIVAAGAGAPAPAASREILAEAAAAIRAGKILAVKGLGGFHLMVAAHDDAAIQRLRRLKHREEKPFAVMFPSLAGVREVCRVSPLEERLLRSPEAPILLLRRHPASGLSSWLAPGNPYLGVLLPYTPLHLLLLSLLEFPVVATSGNLSDEPICTDEHEALERLGGIADLFLVHDRPIVRHVDDSIVRVVAGRELVLRRARGYAPLPVRLAEPAEGRTGLGVGAHLKNAVALAIGSNAFLSQHIGDLETEPADAAFRRVVEDLQRLFEATLSVVAADAHPDYLSTAFARDLAARTPLPLLTVQHHVAHVLSCMAENELRPPALGVSWDGTGYGLDGTVWGGEFFRVTEAACERFAHLRRFRLPGGDRAVKEPRRTALGLLHELYGESAFERNDLPPLRALSPSELASMRTMLTRRLNSPLTSSAGRLFDAVASLVGLRQQVRFEGQAAMELEFAGEATSTDEVYPVALRTQPPSATTDDPDSPDGGTPLVLDWAPAIAALLEESARAVPAGVISAKFHNTLVEGIRLAATQAGLPSVVLSGGCFQNRYLTERAVERLEADGFRVYWHQRVPPNDGGIALGQIAAAFGLSRRGS